MRALGICAAVAVMVAVGACGGSESAETRSDATTSTTTSATTVAPSSTTAPTPLTAEEAATRYLSIVEPYDVALEGLEQAINGGQPVEALRAQADTTAAANAAHIQALRDTLWPPDVQPSVDQLVAESEAAQPSFLQAAQAETRQGVIDAVVAASEHDGGDAAAAIRQLLGLDAYDEEDYSP